MFPFETIEPDDAALALRALAWTLAEPDRASRLLGLTGLTPDDLRARAGESSIHIATLCFLENHEPDLIACADALGLAPAALVAVRQRLEAR
ncbi:MAG: DUF3572 family protein [Sphingomonas sp.]